MRCLHFPQPPPARSPLTMCLAAPSFCRFDRIECERYTNDETIMDANKNSLPEAPDELAGLAEYKVHGSSS